MNSGQGRAGRARRVSRWLAALATVALACAASGAGAASADDASGTQGIEASAARIAGVDRYATAVALSTLSHASGSDIVVLVNGQSFPDALAAAPAAKALQAPVLPVTASSVPAVVTAEVQRLGAHTVLLVGGRSAIGDDVVRTLQGAGLTVARAEGADRYGTAATLALHVMSGPGLAPDVLVSSGTVFADGLIGGAYGAATGEPLLLTDPKTLSSATASTLASLHPHSITVLGGPDAVSDAVLAQLGAYSGSVQRIAGADRYATAAAVESQLWTSAPSAFLADGDAFPDALAAGALGVPVLLTRPGCLPATSEAVLAQWGTTTVAPVGGSDVVSDAAAARAVCP